MRTIALLSALTFATACGDDDTNNANQNNEPVAQSLEIAGEWLSNFGSAETVTSASWNNGFATQTIVSYDNVSNIAVLMTADDATFFPGTYSLINWTEIQNDAFYYCTVDFGRDTAVEALTTSNSADGTDPEAGGCGGFPWTQLNRIQ